MVNLAADIDDQLVVRSDYARSLDAQIETVFVNVLHRRAPQVATWLAATKRAEIPSGDDASAFLQALTIRFQLSRIVDEIDLVRSRRVLETSGGPKAVDGSFAKVLAEAPKDQQVLLKDLASLSIGPTITAHPTEAKRVTVLELHRRIYRSLTRLETDRWTPRERADILNDVEGEIELLWLTGELRLNRPTLSEEIDWGLQFFQESIFNAIPQVFDRLETACAEAGLGTKRLMSPCIKFHSWIGGDRDGNPNVTIAETRKALEKGRARAVKLYQVHLEQVAARLSISNFLIEVPDQNLAHLRAIVGPDNNDRNPNEIFRQVADAIRRKLAGSDYKHVHDFIAELDQFDQALCAVGAENLARKYVRGLRQQVSVFGFRTVTLDIRQNSDVTTAALSSIWKAALDECPEYGTAKWSERLRTELARPDLKYPDRSKLPHHTVEVLALLSLIQDIRTGPDPDAIGPFILSMTRSTDDLLGIYLLARYAGLGSETLDLSVVPLFETIDDLRNAPEILTNLLSVPIARRSIKARGNAVEIMLGYSDSNKDGGFLCSVWELDQAQRKISRTLNEFGLKAAFFHGRGGSVSRGGAPTGRAIAAQPAGTIGGKLRLTEQGEVVSANYANRGTAAARLERLASATLQHSLNRGPEPPKPEFSDAFAALSGTSQAAYAMLLNTPGFVQYFQEASPVEELASLKIGSRPARRSGLSGLSDLRAIPWVFAWSQNRHLITGWYGFGTAVDSFRKFRGMDGEALLLQLFSESPLFQMIVDEVEKSMLQTDLTIGASYADLVQDDAVRQAVFGKIKAEHKKVLESLLFLTSSRHIGERFPKFQNQLSRFQADLARLNDLQVKLLKESRSPQSPQGNSIALLQSINSISAGLGWTG